MKKIIAGVMLLALFVSCKDKKSKIDPFAPITNLVDSALHRKDTVAVPVETGPVPTEADESFNDFIYAYASDDQFQHQRTVFPLPYYNGEVPSKIEERFWKHDDLFTRQPYYTLLFDKEEDMDIVGDTSLKSVQVEWIYMKTQMVKKYYFQRKKGCWMLEAINLRPINKSEDEHFVEFFERFATDSLFQCERIRQPLVFVTNDPDDDDRLSNINYGQSNRDNSATKILALKGIGNGFSNVLYFQRRGGQWELYKFEDTGI
jgi:hypothetical protein